MGTLQSTSKAIRIALLLALMLPIASSCSSMTPESAATTRRMPIPVMILDGQSNRWHDWRSTTAMLQRMLEETGLFRVSVFTMPGEGAELTGSAPAFVDHAAVVLNYDAPDGSWPRDLQQRFEDYVQQGGGLVVVHAANNAFPGWRAYNEMIGVGGWRDRDERAGPAWHVGEDGSLQRDDSAGPAGSHGQRLPFRITVRADHPVTRGLPAAWMHGADELYAGLRGPGGMQVLASAWSDPQNQGTGRHEPQVMVSGWGAGRIFHTTLGHDPAALASADFAVIFQRGVEWSATGGVTQAVPDDFPGPDAASIRQDLLAIGNAYRAHRQP